MRWAQGLESLLGKALVVAHGALLEGLWWATPPHASQLVPSSHNLCHALVAIFILHFSPPAWDALFILCVRVTSAL